MKSLEMIKAEGFAKSSIIADSAEQKSIEEIKREGISRIKPATKGQGSILQGIQKATTVPDYSTPNGAAALIEELKNYCWEKDKRLMNILISRLTNTTIALTR